MTDSLSQFIVLLCLSATGAGAGSSIALINFADKILRGKPVFRFIAEFAVISVSGALLWLIVLLLHNGIIRAFFFIPAAVFYMFCFICIQKLLSPRISSAQKALGRFKSSHTGNFIVKYLLK